MAKQVLSYPEARVLVASKLDGERAGQVRAARTRLRRDALVERGETRAVAAERTLEHGMLDHSLEIVLFASLLAAALGLFARRIPHGSRVLLTSALDRR